MPAKVNLENGPIAIGDRIALSSVPGVGRKATIFEASVGIALEPFSGGLTSGDSGTVMVFMDLQFGVSIELLGDALLGANLSATPPSTATTSTDSTSSPQTASSTPWTASSFLRSLFSTIVQWFASAANGIGDFFANAVHTKAICLSDDMGSSTCVTKAQLDSLLANPANAASAASAGGTGGTGSDSSGGGVSSSTPSSNDGDTISIIDTEAPTLTLNGDNPATIYTGETYADMGATVSDNHDTVLYIYASVDGGSTIQPGDMITLDTTAVADHTITFTVTDEAGNTSSVSRTVHVVMPEAAPAEEPGGDSEVPPSADNGAGTSGVPEESPPAEETPPPSSGTSEGQNAPEPTTETVPEPTPDTATSTTP